ncbi:hypothetical protein BDK51DRAFT_45137 [Blyttiomyces helicus]|uniref:Reverse transcriptase Ty1/copia-type domain-containing protein n=1 Tax=Blyttiomyces helicus TaxID=388810 RepID=A0A4P9WMK7_9FUNG|nr:hypothetical protein BDK51DRAFT_45137 [Blyttiomyces helicus]|eukprot:RKO92410.1 hypothetical protein BDK51DRAFT_45137 [Blyttiomyces helicus]
MASSMLKGSDSSIGLWKKALAAAAYIKNHGVAHLEPSPSQNLPNLNFIEKPVASPHLDGTAACSCDTVVLRLDNNQLTTTNDHFLAAAIPCPSTPLLLDSEADGLDNREGPEFNNGHSNTPYPLLRTPAVSEGSSLLSHACPFQPMTTPSLSSANMDFSLVADLLDDGNDMNQLGDCRTHAKGLATTQRQGWQAAIDKEFGADADNNTISIVPMPKGRCPIRYKLLFKANWSADRSIKLLQVHLVALGFLTSQDFNIFDMFTPTAAANGYGVREMDLKLLPSKGPPKGQSRLKAPAGTPCNILRRLIKAILAPSCTRAQNLVLIVAFISIRFCPVASEYLSNQHHPHPALQRTTVQTLALKDWLNGWQSGCLYIAIDQSRYIMDILKRFDLREYVTIITPPAVHTSLKAWPLPVDPLVAAKIHQYKSRMGSLISGPLPASCEIPWVTVFYDTSAVCCWYLCCTAAATLALWVEATLTGASLEPSPPPCSRCHRPAWRPRFKQPWTSAHCCPAGAGEDLGQTHVSATQHHIQSANEQYMEQEGDQEEVEEGMDRTWIDQTDNINDDGGEDKKACSDTAP